MSISLQDRVEFLTVYVREAHPVDPTQAATPTNQRAGILVRQPTSLAERCSVAERCRTALHLRSKMVVDGIDNRVGTAYAAVPDRLYVIDRQGRVAYQGAPGPFGFNPSEMEQSLHLLLLDDLPAKMPTTQVPAARNGNGNAPGTPNQ